MDFRGLFFFFFKFLFCFVLFLYSVFFPFFFFFVGLCVTIFLRFFFFSKMESFIYSFLFFCNFPFLSLLCVISYISYRSMLKVEVGSPLLEQQQKKRSERIELRVERMDYGPGSGVNTGPGAAEG